MKTNTTALIVVLAAMAAIVPAQTVLQRADLTYKSEPYYTTAFFLPKDWEVWVFDSAARVNPDVEVGRKLWGKGALSLSGYVAFWPKSGEWFGIPWLTYGSRLAGADLSLNLAAYVRPSGQVQIVLSDGSSLMWRDKRGNGAGLVANYWHDTGSAGSLRAGLQMETVYRGTTLRLAYQPFYLQSAGNSVARLEIVTKF